MKTKLNTTLTILAVALAVIAIPNAVYAGGTPAGTSVDNTALISWDAGAIAYTSSDTTSFLVDELINIQVTNNGATALTVWPGETLRPLAFDVQNAGNSTIDLQIQAVGDGSLFVSNANIWNEVVNAGFNAIDDNNNGAAAFTVVSISVDTVYTYYIVADVGASPITTNTPDTYDLLVTAFSGGAPIGTDNSAPFSAGTVEQVMADAGGTAGTDLDYDGQDSAQAVYNLVWAGLTLTKTFTVIDSDPFNTGQHAIPGATVRYTLHVLNSGTGAATALSIRDQTPLGTVFGSNQAPTAGTVVTTNPILWSISSLAGGTSADLVFDVTITGP